MKNPLEDDSRWTVLGDLAPGQRPQSLLLQRIARIIRQESRQLYATEELRVEGLAAAITNELQLRQEEAAS